MTLFGYEHIDDYAGHSAGHDRCVQNLEKVQFAPGVTAKLACEAICCFEKEHCKSDTPSQETQSAFKHTKTEIVSAIFHNTATTSACENHIVSKVEQAIDTAMSNDGGLW